MIDRLRTALGPVALASLAAALAWLFAHRVLGHTQPFFAPIAAAITLSSSRIQRSRRITQMVGGVLLGIAVGELLDAALGTSAATLALIVFLTMGLAIATGIGFVGEGMMYVNQAAASAILVVTVHRAGTGGERTIDALVGGAVSLVLGVLLFPAQPLKLLQAAERDVLRALAEALETLPAVLRGKEPGDPDDWAQRTGYQIHQRLSALARARATARTNVRVAPRRWHLRASVIDEDKRVARLDLLGNAVISLSRASIAEQRRRGALPEDIDRQIGLLGAALSRLAGAGQPWGAGLLADVDRTASGAAKTGEVASRQGTPVVGAILSAVGRDLAQVTRWGR